MTFSFEVLDQSCAEHALHTAILLYGRGSNGADYATIHNVDRQPDGSAIIGTGRPITRNAIRDVARALSTRNQRRGIFPTTLLSAGDDYAMWWSPPARRTLFFQTRPEADREVVGSRSGMCFCPGVIFVARQRSLSVFAVKGDERPTADTPLYYAPFMNVNDHGTVCMGTVPIPEGNLIDSMAEWEQGFWNSYFSHPNHPRPTSYKGGIHALWLALLDGKKHRAFPQTALRRIGKMTVSDLIWKVEQ